MTIPGIQSKRDEGDPSPEDIHFPHNLTLYGRGEAIMFHKRGRYEECLDVERLSLTGENLGMVLIPSIETEWGRTRYISILNTDESGRFIVLATITGKSREILLHDSRDGKRVFLNLRGERKIGNSWGTNIILFVNESALVIFAVWNEGSVELSISTWNVSSSESGPSKVASREYRDTLSGMCVSPDRETLYLVTTNRTITRLTLPHLEERESYLGFHGQHQEAIETFPAGDGTHIASVRSDQMR
jgi:hypothetical protein